jgi:hypothetical protein
MDAQKEAYKLLKEHGEQVRHNKHEAWRLNGHLITITKTKTCERGWLNKLTEIRRALNVSACQHFQAIRRNGKVASA